MKNLHCPPETSGSKDDLILLSEDEWLKQSVVIPFIEKRKGRFQVSMVYASTQHPFRLRVRRIDDYPTLSRARQSAEYFKRGMQRDPRGTSKLDLNDFDLCAN